MTISAEVIAPCSSERARAADEPARFLSTARIRLILSDIARYQSSAAAGSATSEPPLLTSEIALCSWPSAREVGDPETASWYSWRCRVVARALNTARLLCSSAAATINSSSEPGTNRPKVNATSRMARCRDASSFIIATTPSTRTVSASVASPPPWAISSSIARRSSIVAAYSSMRSGAGKRVPVAVVRRLPRPSILVSKAAARACVCAGYEAPTPPASAVTCRATRSVAEYACRRTIFPVAGSPWAMYAAVKSLSSSTSWASAVTASPRFASAATR